MCVVCVGGCVWVCLCVCRWVCGCVGVYGCGCVCGWVGGCGWATTAKSYLFDSLVLVGVCVWVGVLNKESVGNRGGHS